MKKANPIPVAYPPCFPAEKKAVLKCYIQVRYSSENLTYSVRSVVVDSGEDFINLNSVRSFPFESQIMKHFLPNMMFSKHGNLKD